MKKILLLSLWAFFATSASAQEAPSIYSTHLPTDLTITGVSLVTTTLLYAFDGKIINRRCPCLTSEINSFDRGVVGNHNDTALILTDIGVGAAMTIPILADWFLVDGWNQAFIEDTLVFTQVLAVTGAFASVVKSIVQRPVPRAYQGDPEAMSKTTGYRSFFSGHVSMMTAALTAAAVTVEARTSARVWPWFVVGGGGLLVAAGRVAGGVHFYTDVIVGGAVGVGAGLLIPWLHKRRGEMGTVMVVPQQGGALALWTLAL